VGDKRLATKGTKSTKWEFLFVLFVPFVANLISMLKSESKTLHVGDPAPRFELPTADRAIIRLSDYAGKPLALVFIRGTW
jgi:hypothetical protein